MRTHVLYILDEMGEPRPATSHLEWATFMDRVNVRKIAFTALPDGGEVSTVFLGFNLSISAVPVLFETMVYLQQGRIMHCERYATRKEALRGHDRAVETFGAFDPVRVVRERETDE